MPKKPARRAGTIAAAVAAGLLGLSAAMAQTPSFTQRHAPFGVGCPACHGAEPAAPVPDTTCLGCHGSREALEALTREATPNPHAEHHVGAVRCGQCHKEHQPSVLLCNQCHIFEMEVP